MVASSVIAVLAQRLVRKICTRCKTNYIPTESVLEDAGIPADMAKHGKFSKGKGCPYCQKKGYRGRIGIYELMVVNGRLREMMFRGVSSADLRIEAIKQGMTTLYCDGIRKVMNGITTLDEVYRTAKRTEQEDMAMQTLIREYAAEHKH
jgi:type IV pilus assembly protein PilB